VNAVKIYLSLELLVPSEEAAPVGLEVLVLLIFLLARVDVEDIPDLVDLVLLLFGRVVAGVGVVGEGVDGRRQGRRRALRLGALRVLLALPLVSQLVVDVGVEPSYLVVVDEDGDLALPVSQLLPLLLHFLPCPQGLGEGFVLDQHVGALRGQFVAFDFQIPDVSEAGEEGGEVLFVGELGVVADGGVEDGDEVLLDLVERVVADDVEALEVVSEEDLEVVVVGLVERGVDVVVVRAGVGGVLHLEVLHEHEVLYHLHVLDLPVLPEEGADRLLARIVQSRHVELPHQDALVDLLWRLRLLHELLLLGFWQFGEQLMDGQVVGDGVVPDRQPHLLLALLRTRFLIVSFLSRARAGVRAVPALVPAAVFLPLVVVVTLPAAVFVGIRTGAGSSAGPAFRVRT
jgi:hypothetical protein